MSSVPDQAETNVLWGSWNNLCQSITPERNSYCTHHLF